MIDEDVDLTPDPYLDPGRIILSDKKIWKIEPDFFIRNSDPEADHTLEVVHDLAQDKRPKNFKLKF